MTTVHRSGWVAVGAEPVAGDRCFRGSRTADFTPERRNAWRRARRWLYGSAEVAASLPPAASA